jgi:hypothetical protein
VSGLDILQGEVMPAMLPVEIDSGLLPPAPMGWETANLPQIYQEAREKLTRAATIDECADMQAKAEAFASYYRQAKDKTFFYLAQRIRLRAIRRCGELYMEQGLTIREAGAPARVVSEAKKLAAVPKKVFEKAIEKSPPPSLSQLIGPRKNYERLERDDIQNFAAELVRIIGWLDEHREKLTGEQAKLALLSLPRMGETESAYMRLNLFGTKIQHSRAFLQDIAAACGVSKLFTEQEAVDAIGKIFAR